MEIMEKTHQQESGWTDTDTEIFIKYGHCFVPEREKQFQVVSRLLSQLTASPHIVEISCGPGLLAESIMNSIPGARMTLLDASSAMLEEASHRLAQHKEQINTQLFDIHDKEWRHFSEPVDAFISSLAVHHLSHEEKEAFFIDLYQNLSEGGVFVNADLIRPVTPLGDSIAAELWDEATLNRSRQFEGNETAYEAFKHYKWNYFLYPDDPIDKPSPLFAQLKWLEAAGFEDVDVYWLDAGHAVYAGFKR